VSGVNAAAVSGVQVLDDTKLATYATLATAGELNLQVACTFLANIVPYSNSHETSVGRAPEHAPQWSSTAARQAGNVCHIGDCR
jgi:hypothetical protein